MSHFIHQYPGDTKKFNSTKALSGVLENTNSVELSSFQGIGFQTCLIVFTSLVMSNLLVFVSLFDMLKKNVMYLSLIPSFGTFIQLLSVSFPSPPTSFLWCYQSIYFSVSVLFYLSLEGLIKRNAECSSNFSPMSNHVQIKLFKRIPNG